MSPKNYVPVKILYLRGQSGSCPCACGSALDTPEGLQALHDKCRELKEALDAKYPGKASVDVIDMNTNPAETSTPGGQLLAQRQYPSPLIVIDGEPRFAGLIEIKRILEEVGKILDS